LYADGLIKYEPGDLLNVPVIIPRETKGAMKVYLSAAKELIAGNAKAASRIADKFLCLNNPNLH
jgi:hypothetical protein